MRLPLPLLLAAVLPTSVDRAAAAVLPDFAEVERAVKEIVNQSSDYQPGDLLTRSQARVMFDRIEKLGWKLADRDALQKRVLDDGSYLVGKAKTPGGKKFFRQVAAMRLAYDRLDRLAQLPQGRSTVDRLIQGPDGYKLIEYMANEKGGKELAKMLSKDGKGDFNQPTGKIYTAEVLLKELELRYEAEVARTAKR